MSITQVSAVFRLMNDNYLKIDTQKIDTQVKKPWAAMTTIEKFLYIITVGILSPTITIPVDAKDEFDAFVEAIAVGIAINIRANADNNNIRLQNYANKHSVTAFFYDLEIEYSFVRNEFYFVSLPSYQHQRCSSELITLIFNRAQQIHEGVTNFDASVK
ncbi:hypothetical protein F9222_23575 [Escherichia coli]|nr:hypothetical protein F9222_23575 [Escherichia coli]